MPIQNMYYVCGRPVSVECVEFIGNKHTDSLTYSALYVSTDLIANAC